MNQQEIEIEAEARKVAVDAHFKLDTNSGQNFISAFIAGAQWSQSKMEGEAENYELVQARYNEGYDEHYANHPTSDFPTFKEWIFDNYRIIKK